MELQVIGAHPLARDKDGKLLSRIATIFPSHKRLVTLPGIHATQRLACADLMDEERRVAGCPPLSTEERQSLWEESVDLIIEGEVIYIRPDVRNIELALRADELLVEVFPKRQVQFLETNHDRVREAIKGRGECWRIMPIPRSVHDMKQMIADSRIALGGRPIYYYNKNTGTRLLTCHAFSMLSEMGEPELRQHLQEVQHHSMQRNRLGNSEVSFFTPTGELPLQEFAGYDFNTLDAAGLRVAHESMLQLLRAFAPPELWHDNSDDSQWRAAMFMALVGRSDEPVPEEVRLGLSSEFFMQIDWLPGGRIEAGELILDSVFEEHRRRPEGAERPRHCDERVCGFIFNFIREYGDLEYINIGRVRNTTERHAGARGSRGVYIAELKPRGSPEVVKIIRMQKWGVREHLDDGLDLLEAMVRSEEYTEYILDRRLACRQLGMNLSTRIGSRKICESYSNPRRRMSGLTIWTPYFERDYVRGVATDKVSNARLEDRAFATRFARLLGRAAAPNMIVGRADAHGKVIFDDGDEILVPGENGLPVEIVVADPTGCFCDYYSAFSAMAVAYAAPVNRRGDRLASREEFGELYLDGLRERFVEIQQEYRRRRRAFDTLFNHRRRDEPGGLTDRWRRVLMRLDGADVDEIVRTVRAYWTPV